MEVEDQIIQESDVYLTKTISSNLHIFDYAVKSSPFTQRQQIKVKARPNHNMFEIETNVDTNSKNFDRRKSQLFAHYLENDSKSDEKPNVSNSERLLNKEVLKSVEVKPTLSQYCLALIRNDCPEVHLTPFNSVIQFRPSFHYLDKSDINFGKTKHNSKDESEAEADASSQDESEAQTEVQTITMRFAGPDEERLRKAREKSFNYLQQQVAKDPWIELNFHPIKSHSSTEEKMSLLFNSSQDNRNHSNDSNTSITSLENFLDSIKLSNEELLRTKSALELSSNSLEKPSLSQIRSFPLAEQVRLLLINAKILSFDQIIKLLMGKFEANSILKTLQMYALLVQGNWVVKSEILYNKETSSSSYLTGIPTELLCRARDFIIWKFTQTKSLYKKDIFSSDKNKIPEEEIVEILSQIAVFDAKTKCWNFMLPQDLSFIEKYPEVVQRQQLLWSNRYTSIERAYSNVNIKTEDQTIKLPQRKRRNSRKSSVNSNSTDDNDGNESSNTEPFFNVTNSDVNNTSFCGPSPTKLKNERKSPVKTLSNRKFNTPTAIKERRRSKGPKMAVFEINPTVSLYPSPEERKELVKCIHEKLKNSFCTTSTDLRKYISENSSNKFWFDLSEEFIESAVNESGGFRVQNKWPQNSPQQPLYAFTKFGDQLDGFRDTLFEMFSDQTRVRVSHFQEKVRDKQIFGEKNCENTCLKLLKDYCILKSSMYYLKGTVNAT